MRGTRLYRKVLLGIGKSMRERSVPFLHGTGKGFGSPAFLLRLQIALAPTHPCCRCRGDFHKLQWLWPVPQLPTSFLPQETAATGRGRTSKEHNNPKPSHLSSLSIYQQTKFSASLPLSLAHNQMIAQGFAVKREAVGPALPLSIWVGASHYT